MPKSLVVYVRRGGWDATLRGISVTRCAISYLVSMSYALSYSVCAVVQMPMPRAGEDHKNMK